MQHEWTWFHIIDNWDSYKSIRMVSFNSILCQFRLMVQQLSLLNNYICILKGVRNTQNLGTISTIWTLYINIVRNYPLHYPSNLVPLLRPFSTHNSTSHLGEGKRRCSGRRGSRGRGCFFLVPNVFLFGFGGKKWINKVWIYIAIIDARYFLTHDLWYHQIE